MFGGLFSFTAKLFGCSTVSQIRRQRPINNRLQGGNIKRPYRILMMKERDRQARSGIKRFRVGSHRMMKGG